MKILVMLVLFVLLAEFADAETVAFFVEQFNNTVRGNCKQGPGPINGQGGGGGNSTNNVQGGGTGNPTINVQGGGTGNPTNNVQGGGTGNPTNNVSGGNVGSSTITVPVVNGMNLTANGTNSTGLAPPPELHVLRLKRDVLPCEELEKKVIHASDISDFNTKITEYSQCQTENCNATSADVIAATKKLKEDSGAASVKVFGTLLVIMFGIAFFG